MANSGAPQFPQPGQYRPDTSQTRSAGSNSERAVGNLNRAPDEIRAEITARRKEIRAVGEVTRVEKDGNIRVSTPRGDIDVRLSADERHARRPQVGQRVEVTITPPARGDSEQPVQVTIRPAQSQTAESQTPTRSSATPVQIEVREGQEALPPQRVEIARPAPNAAPPPNRFPESGSLVRLDPISPQQLEQLVESRQIIIAETVRASVTLPSVSDVLPSQNAGTITASPPSFSSVQTLNISGAEQALSAPSLNAPTSVVTTVNNFTITEPIDQNSLTVPILNRAQTAIEQLQNAANAVLNVDNSSSASAPLSQDARVGNINAAQVILSAPNQTLEVSPQNALPSSQNAAQISGVVIAKTQTHVPIVQFSVPQNAGQPLSQAILNAPLNAPISAVEQQTFILQFPSDALLLGSRIDVTPQNALSVSASVSQPTAITQAIPPIPFANIAFPQPWPAMQDIQQTLLQSTAHNAAQTAQAFTSVLPNPANSSQFGPAALFFIAAVRGGDIGSWLSDKASDILRESGKGSLLSRISSEAAGLSRGADAPSGEWRGMHIPLFWDGDIQQIALHYRHDNADSKDDEQNAGNKGTRFIFDLNLDVMGKVQLDGFFRPVSENGPRLDIVLRTEERFSSAMQAEMRRVYMDAIKPSQVGGELSFQDGIDSWVMIDAQDKRELGVNA